MDISKSAAKKNSGKAVFELVGLDPLSVLRSTKPIVENARFAVIDAEKIKPAATKKMSNWFFSRTP